MRVRHINLRLLLPGHLSVLLGHGRVHGSDTRVALLRHVVRVLTHAGGSLQHVYTRVLLVVDHTVDLVCSAGRKAVAVRAVVLLLLLLRHRVTVHVLAEVGK